MVEYCERVKNTREDRDFTQEQIAAVLKIDQSKYSKIENKTRKMTIEEMIELCKFYNLSADYLLGITDEPRRLK